MSISEISPMFDLSSQMQDRSQAKDLGVRNLSLYFVKVRHESPVVHGSSWVYNV